MAPRQQWHKGDDDRRGWHFEKRLSLDTLISVLGIAAVIGGPILVWGRAMEGRVQSLEIIQTERQKTEDTTRSLTNQKLEKLDDRVTTLQIGIGKLSAQIEQITPMREPRNGR
jgi:hypothetical protein